MSIDPEVSSYLKLFNCTCTTSDPSHWKKSCRLFYLLLNIIDGGEFDDSSDQVNSVLYGAEKCCSSLEICVKRQQDRLTYYTTTQNDEEYRRLTGCLRIFYKLFTDKIFSSSIFDDAKLDYIIGVLSVISVQKQLLDVEEFKKMWLQMPTQVTVNEVFRFLMMAKGFKGLSKELQLLVHRELMKIVRSTNGFQMLCRSILIKTDDERHPKWQKYNMISKIIESNKINQQFMILEIFKTLDLSLQNKDADVAGASVFTIKSLEEAKDNIALKTLIHSKITEPLQQLVKPDVVLYGSIVMEHRELKKLIHRLYALFSTSTISSLPTRILMDHTKILFDLYVILEDSPERRMISDIIIFILSNRKGDELRRIMRELRLKESTIPKLYERICYKNGALQIGNEQNFDDTEKFLSLLKSSNNNFLIYDIFLCLIKILADVQDSGDHYLSQYDVPEEDISEVLNIKFFKRLSVLEPLQEMVQWKSMQSIFNERPKELIEAVKINILNLVESRNNDETTIILLFSILRELISKLKDADERKVLIKDIYGIKMKCSSSQIRNQIDIIFDVHEDIESNEPTKMTYEQAIKLLQSPEIYCKAYGSDSIIKLLKNRDHQTITNRHTILALALQNLKETESYAYLNVIRVLVALTNVIDIDVMEALIALYKNSDTDIDERLKIGEVIVKVTEHLKESAFKFRHQIIHCFLIGSRDNSNEFRTSSLANLGTVCKILSYQIHNFFQEMFQQLEIIIKTDNYLPSKRAAAMVLTQILAGLPNIMDFQDYLLPLYRLMKDILAMESDPQTKLHAQIAMEYLNTKTKDFLNPILKMEKDVNICLDDPNKLKEIKYK